MTQPFYRFGKTRLINVQCVGDHTTADLMALDPREGLPLATWALTRDGAGKVTLCLKWTQPGFNLPSSLEDAFDMTAVNGMLDAETEVVKKRQAQAAAAPTVVPDAPSRPLTAQERDRARCAQIHAAHVEKQRGGFGVRDVKSTELGLEARVMKGLQSWLIRRRPDEQEWTWYPERPDLDFGPILTQIEQELRTIALRAGN